MHIDIFNDTAYKICKNLASLGKEIQNQFKMELLTNPHYMLQFPLKIMQDGRNVYSVLTAT